MLKSEAPQVKIGDRVKWNDTIGIVEGFPTRGVTDLLNPQQTHELDPKYFYVQVKLNNGYTASGAPSAGTFEVLKS